MAAFCSQGSMSGVGPRSHRKVDRADIVERRCDLISWLLVAWHRKGRRDHEAVGWTTRVVL